MQNWDDYRYFLAVAETGSVSAAARELGTTQPTVGRRIAELERRLGQALFVRGPGGYRLNPVGARVHERVRTIEVESRWIEDKLRYADDADVGRVTFTMVDSLAAFVISPRVAEFNALHPHIELDLMINYDAVDLFSGTADVALRVGLPGSGEYVGRRLGSVHFGLYAARSYVDAFGEPRHVDELPRHRVIDSVRRIAELPQVRKLREFARGAPSVFACDSIPLQIDAVAAGLGIVALPVYAAADRPELVRVLTDEFDIDRDLWLLTHRDLKATKRVRAVLDFFADSVGAHFRSLEARPDAGHRRSSGASI